MAFRTLPPHLFVAACGYHLRSEVAIQVGMPLFRNLRLNGGKVIEARQHLPIAAIRAVRRALCFVRNDCTVLMSLFAYPPCPAIAERCDHFRSQMSVFRWVPLRCNARVSTCKVVHARNDYFAGTNGTTISVGCSRQDRSFPFVALFALPPDFA